MPIKVLVISNYRDYHTVRPEAELFIGLAKLGFEVYVITYPDASYIPRFKENGIHVIEAHPTSKNDKESQRIIRETIIEKKIQILQLYNAKGVRNALKAAKDLPVKFVLYRGYSDNIHWYDPSMHFKYLHPRVDKIICNSIGVKELFDKQLFFDKDKAVAINKGHRLEWYSDVQPKDIRSEVGISSDSLLLVNVANNRKMKGIPFLLKAINALPEEANINLLLIGRDMDSKENLQLLSNPTNRKKVHFLGFRTDALEVVASCDSFVSSSITGESITKSIIESMALEVAPIITDIVGNRELVLENENGLIAKKENSESLKEAILKLYYNRELIAQFGKKSKERIATHLHSEQTIEKVKELYESLLH